MSQRSKAPSMAVTVGTVAGIPVGQIVVQSAQEFGLEIGPATASLVSILLSALFAYFAPGGRRGDAR